MHYRLRQTSGESPDKTFLLALFIAIIINLQEVPRWPSGWRKESYSRNIHRIESLVSCPRASRGNDNLHKGSISNNLCDVKTVDINNHVSSNVTSTNSSLTFLNCAVFNSRSVRNKIESITDHVAENDIGPCSVTETCLNDADSASIAQLSVAGYFFKKQSQNRGGGTGILLRDYVNVSLVDGKENKSFEFSEWIS